MVYGDVVVLLCDGRMLLENLRGSKLSLELLASELRAHGMQHLGELRRLYMETSGEFSLIRFEKPEPGLSLSPDHDDEFNRELRSADKLACWSCGATVPRTGTAPVACTYCAAECWLPAVETLTPPVYEERVPTRKKSRWWRGLAYARRLPDATPLRADCR